IVRLIFFFRDTSTTEISTLSLHDALPICPALTEDSPPWVRFGTVSSALAKGYKLGFIASSDHLSTHISYACLLAERLTLDALLRSEEHTSELQSRGHLVCRLLLEKKKMT